MLFPHVFTDFFLSEKIPFLEFIFLFQLCDNIMVSGTEFIIFGFLNLSMLKEKCHHANN